MSSNMLTLVFYGINVVSSILIVYYLTNVVIKQDKEIQKLKRGRRPHGPTR